MLCILCHLSNSSLFSPSLLDLVLNLFMPGKSRGRGAWWATVHRVTKSWSQLSSQATAIECITPEADPSSPVSKMVAVLPNL